MNIDLKTKKACFYDNGLFVSLAERCVGEFAEVGYFAPWESGFPDGVELMVGGGLKGVKRIVNFWEVLDDYDLFIFPDCWFGDLQVHLRKLGKRVFGSGAGAEIELSRWKTHERLEGIGLPASDAVRVIGIDALRAYLREHEDQYVKISKFRGLGETWHSVNYKLSTPQLDDMESQLGARKNIVPFIVEAAIPDSVEVGYDGICIDGQFPQAAAVYGIEVKDKAYLGRLVPYDKLPEGVGTVNDALSPVLRELQYRNFFSTEIRFASGKPYLIDTTARQASPAGEVFTTMFKNLAEMLWHGAEGVLVEPEADHEWGAQIIICSEWYLKHWTPIKFPESVRPFVKIYNHCKIGDIDYAVPQQLKMTQVGSVIGLGKTQEEAIKQAKEHADQIEGFDLDFEVDALDKAAEEMNKL